MNRSEEYKDELRQILLQGSPYNMNSIVSRLMGIIPDKMLIIVFNIAVRRVHREADALLLKQVLNRMSPEARENALEELFLELQEDVYEQKQVLVTLAPYLPPSFLDEALARAQKITHDPHDKVELLQALLPRLPELQQVTILQEILHVLQANANNKLLYDNTLVQLAPKFNKQLFQEAIEMAYVVEQPERRVELFMALATVSSESLRADLWQLALRSVDLIGGERNWAEIQVNSLLQLLPYIPEAQWLTPLLTALRTVDLIKQPRTRLEILLRLFALTREQIVKLRDSLSLPLALTGQAADQGIGQETSLSVDLIMASHSEKLYDQMEPQIAALTGAHDRAELLSQLALLWPQKRNQLMQEALDTALTLEDLGERAETLIILADSLTGDLKALALEKARSAAKALRHEVYRARVLGKLLPYLTLAQREEAISDIRQVLLTTNDVFECATLLSLLATSIADLEREQRAKELLQMLPALTDARAVQALVLLFPLLPVASHDSAQYLVSQVLKKHKKRVDVPELVPDLLELVPLLLYLDQPLKDELVQEMMKHILLSTSPRYKVIYLLNLLPHLSHVLLSEGLHMLTETVPQVEQRRGNAHEQADQLIKMLSSLTGKSRDEVFLQIRQLLQEVWYAHEEVALTLAFCPFLADEERQRYLQHALDVASTVGDAPYRVDMLLKLLPHLDEHLLSGAVQTTLLLLSTFQDPEARIRSFAELLPMPLEKERLPIIEEALLLVLSLTSPRDQSRLLAMLAPSLTEEQCRVEVQAMLVRAEKRSESSDHDMSDVLCNLAPLLEEETLLKSLELIKRMQEDSYKIETLQALLTKLTNEHLLLLVQELTQHMARSPNLLRLQARIEWLLAGVQTGARGISELLEKEKDDLPTGVMERVFSLLNLLTEEEREEILQEILQEILLMQFLGRGAGGRVRFVNTGFASLEEPGEMRSPYLPLLWRQDVYFCLEIGALLEGTIDDQPVLLPPLEGEVKLRIVLFPLTDGLQLLAEADTGEIVLQDDGAAIVVHQPHSPENLPSESDMLTRRLFFPLRLPEHGDFISLLCNIYYGQILLQSRHVRGKVMAAPRPMRGALSSHLVYTIAPAIDPSYLRRMAESKLSIFIDDGSQDALTFCLFGAEGEQRFKRAFSQDSLKFQDLLKMARQVMRKACWGSEHDWQGEAYRYDDSCDLERLREDLVRFAICGYRIYDVLIGIGGITNNENLTKGLEILMREPGFVQIALKRTPSSIPPLSLMYDYPLDTNAPFSSYTLCPDFIEMLQRQLPLEELACFRGACPAREAPLVVCPGGFWGFRHYLGLPLSLGSGNDVLPEITYRNAPEWLVSAYHDLVQREQHLAKMQTFWPGLTWNYIEKREELLEQLSTISPQLVYFYCHGGMGRSGPYIQVGTKDDMGITRDNLRLAKIDWEQSRPLVFINGCHTTALEPEKAMEFVSAFVGYSASGVIGTEISVFEPLACQFAETCLSHFLQGVTIGEAVRKARLALLLQGNPLGLVYIPFVFPSLRLIKENTA